MSLGFRNCPMILATVGCEIVNIYETFGDR
jgi:hypothetical protein